MKVSLVDYEYTFLNEGYECNIYDQVINHDRLQLIKNKESKLIFQSLLAHQRT